MAGKLFIVSAPSGAGKTTLVTHVIERLKDRVALERVVTYTTKSVSSQEKNGEDYHFISTEEFECKVQAGFFVEWSGAYGKFYGSPQSMFADLDAGKSLILVIDRVGAQKIMSAGYKPILIWLKPVSIDVLEQRLKNRGRDSFEDIKYRLEQAQRELTEEEQNKLYNYHLINDDFNETLKKLEIILMSEIFGANQSIAASGGALEMFSLK